MLNTILLSIEDIKFSIELAARIVEFLGVAVIVWGVFFSLTKWLFTKDRSSFAHYKILRQNLGKAILLGLEILVAADIVSTVVTEPTMQKVLILAVVVLIRTFLSVSIQMEVEGKFPWEKKK